jgi:hypothetical protein
MSRSTGPLCSFAHAADGTTSPRAASTSGTSSTRSINLRPEKGGGGPAHGDAASYWWNLPGGSGEWTAGGFGPHGVWINGIVPLLLVCEVLKLRPPSFASAAQRAEAAALRRQIGASRSGVEMQR